MSVAIVMGSDSDLDIVSKAFGVLDDFGVSYTKNVFSAHRTPDKVLELIKSSEENGVEVFIAAAGMAAHLAGVVAAHTTKPVIGIPIPSLYTDILFSSTSKFTLIFVTLCFIFSSFSILIC